MSHTRQLMSTVTNSTTTPTSKQPTRDRNFDQIDIEASTTNQLKDRANSLSSSNSRRSVVEADDSSISSAEQVVTSLQVNSKKAPPISKSNVIGSSPKAAAAELASVQALVAPSQPVVLKKIAKPPSVLDPSGSLYYHWSMVVSFAFVYNFWSLSYRFAFREIDYDTMPIWFALDYSADIIYALDIVINCRTGYLEDGVLQRSVGKIRQHYRESTIFYLDCLCLLPLDVLYLSFGFNSVLRCTRLVKIYKFWSYVDRTERHTNYPNIFRTFALVHYILVIFHWNACIFHMISKNNIIDIANLYKINDNRCHDILCQYLHAFYWSTLALTTIGDLPRPRTKGEYIYVTVELFFGLFLFASVLGHVANIVTNVSAARKEFQAKLDAVKTFMRMRRVSDELQNKVIRWFDYLWISQQSSDEDKSVACLPDRLKAEIAIHVHLDTLKRVDIFQNTEAGFLCELVLRLKPVLFSPGDYVCRKNEVGHEMYIVSRGILEVVTDEGKVVVATLKAGSYFGEISVLNVGLAGNKRTASVRSVGYSDLFCLNKQDLWDVLKNYPNAEARIRARAEERLSKLDINSSQQQIRRRSSGDRRPLSGPNSAKIKSQLDQMPQQSSSGGGGSRRLQSSSCGCFALNGCSEQPRRASANTANKTTEEFVCCRYAAAAADQQQDNEQTCLGLRSRQMPFIRCHKSRASLNNGLCRRHQTNGPLPGAYRTIQGSETAYFDSVGSSAAYGCRLPNCRRQQHQHQRPTDWQNHSSANGISGPEPVSHSRSFQDQEGRIRKRQQLRRGDSEEAQAEISAGNSSMSSPSSPSPLPPPTTTTMTQPQPQTQIDNDNSLMTIRSSRSPRLTRRSSSAEPPIEAESWRHQLSSTANNYLNSSSATSSRLHRPRYEGQPNQQYSCSVSIDEGCSPSTGGGGGGIRANRHQKGSNRRAAADMTQHIGTWNAPPLGQAPLAMPSTGYWIYHQQPLQGQLQPQPQPQPPTSQYIQVPLQLAPPASLTITPDSQQSSSIGGGNGDLASQSVSPAIRAQSMSTMYLNLPRHQAALLSPVLPSLHSTTAAAQQQLSTSASPQNQLYFELPQAQQQQQQQQQRTSYWPAEDEDGDAPKDPRHTNEDSAKEREKKDEDEEKGEAHESQVDDDPAAIK